MKDRRSFKEMASTSGSQDSQAGGGTESNAVAVAEWNTDMYVDLDRKNKQGFKSHIWNTFGTLRNRRTRMSYLNDVTSLTSPDCQAWDEATHTWIWTCHSGLTSSQQPTQALPHNTINICCFNKSKSVVSIWVGFTVVINCTEIKHEPKTEISRT